MRRPGVEPGSIAWKATMLTATPPTLLDIVQDKIEMYLCKGQRLEPEGWWYSLVNGEWFERIAEKSNETNNFTQEA